MIRNMESSAYVEDIFLRPLYVLDKTFNPYLNQRLLFELCFTESYNNGKPLKIWIGPGLALIRLSEVSGI